MLVYLFDQANYTILISLLVFVGFCWNLVYFILGTDSSQEYKSP